MKSPFLAPPWLVEAWTHRLHWHFHCYNAYYADGRLRAPLFVIGASRERLGEWNGLHRTITISHHHILEHPWESVLITLRHEMAHQYVEEVFRLPGAPPHGDAFARACRILRVEPAAAARGELPGGPAFLAEREKMLGRVKDLLAMAGSPNENEAANAMRLARKYLLKYNLDLAEVKADRSYGSRCLGKCSSRVQEYEYALAGILQDHFFVQVVWVFSYDPLLNRPGRILQVVGAPENLQIAEYVHSYVMNLTVSLWRAHLDSGRARGGTRLQYLAGLLRGLSDKLDKQTVELKTEHGLIWSGDPLLEEYFRYLSPRLERLGGRGVSRGEDFAAGLRDGKKITIRRGISGETVNRGRLLGGGDGGR